MYTSWKSIWKFFEHPYILYIRELYKKLGVNFLLKVINFCCKVIKAICQKKIHNAISFHLRCRRKIDLKNDNKETENCNTIIVSFSCISLQHMVL